MEYDGIILGAGHNGLILQAYLGRAGLKTLCLERRGSVGGGLETVSFPDGSEFLHNTHSFYHRGVTHLPWYHDLDLRHYGAEYVEPELNVAQLCRDGGSLQWWTDFDRTVASFANFSKRDADSLVRWRDAFLPIVRDILIPESQQPPMPPNERHAKLEQSRAGRLLLETSRLSPLEFVHREFEHPTVQAGLLFFNGLREVDLRLHGFGHHIPALLASGRFAQMCLGGSQRLAEALVAAVEQTQGQIRVNVTPRRLLVEAGRVCGVETHDGEVFQAKHFVASSLNPQQTFLELIESDQMPYDWRTKASQFRYNLLAPLFGLYLNLDEAPRYSAVADSPELAQAFMVIVGLEHVDQFQEIVNHHESGHIPPTVMWGSCPTQFDASQAPAGAHTAFMWEKLPYQLHGDAGNWDAMKHRHADEMLRVWTASAPNIRDSIRDMFCRSPLDTERALPNMLSGDLLVGAFAHGQVGYHRPFTGAGHYRTYLPGLYLCGSCCHPGGNITGLPGCIAAQVIQADLGLGGHNHDVGTNKTANGWTAE